MAKIRDIQRTAAFAWSPDTDPFIATGTQAGAVAADFSDNTQLELWDLDLGGNSQAELSPVASVNTDSKFYDIAWGRLSADKPRGIIAGALENGSLDLWSADALLDKSDNPLISQTTKHSGAIKSLQFNPFKSELLATAGAKGELYVWDLNNTDSPFMLGNKVARADDFDCLDWNKKVPHILVTGGSGGFLTVWDVKTKKESLTLNNLNRKAVSAVAWHPDQQTKLITAIPDDTSPVILMWDLRNSHAPERTLTGHSAGVLSLSWCRQDSDLLLSCGKDNRTICWNPQSGEMLGEFPVVTNWTFKTTFHPRNPAYIATASYDGKIAVRTLQNTNPQVDHAGATAAADGDDFFSRASNAQTSSFSLKQTPKWFKRPVGATFGFGGKLVSFSSTAAAPNQSKVKISTVPIDSSVNAATELFEKAVQEGNLAAVCDEKARDAKSEDEKSEWQVLKALFDHDTKAKLVEYLGFKAEDIATPDPEKAGEEEEEEGGGGSGAGARAGPDGEAKGEAADRLSAFFGDGDDSENFLASLSIRSTQTARTNNPFRIYTGDETKADKAITKAVVLGEYERAVDVCLKEDRITDAFMLAICGGDPCIDKVKAAYFTKKSNGPNYLRLLASVVGKNLWDVVHNADLANWKEVVGALCTHASDSEFPDLIEALGDRLEEESRSKDESGLRQAALLCYLGGSKLHKVVGIWIGELHEAEKVDLQAESEGSTFSVHARSLQNFIEKVSVFREAVKFVDNEKALPSGWKLSPLYEKYCEYADVVASHGQLAIAGKYLDLLPPEYPAARVARNRVKQATTEAPATAQVHKPLQPAAATTGFRTQQPFHPAQQPTPPNPHQPAAPYMPQASAAPALAPYQQLGGGGGGGGGGYRPTAYQSPQPAQPTQPIAGPYAPQYAGAAGYAPSNMGQPPRFVPPAPAAPPPAPPKGPMTNWNDTPEVVRPPRKPTPAQPLPQTSAPPFPGAPPIQSPPQQAGVPWGAPPPRATPPPPPKGLPPQRVQSPAGQLRPNSPAIAGPGYQQAAPPPPQGQYAPPPQPSGRYTPQPTQPSAGGPPGTRPGMHPPPPQGAVIPARTSSAPQYAAPPSVYGQQAPGPSPYAPQQRPQQPPQGPYAPPQGAPPPQGNYAPPQGAPPPPPPQGNYAPPQGAPPPQGNYAPPAPGSQGPPPARPPPAGQHVPAPPPKPATPAPAPPKHPKGDRSHIPAQHAVIYELLTADMERVKARAPPNFSRQVTDTEKRLGILFDHINNEELLSAETLESMATLARALAAKDHLTAHNIQVNLMTNKTTECAQWMTGVKRLIEMSRVAE